MIGGTYIKSGILHSRKQGTCMEKPLELVSTETRECK